LTENVACALCYLLGLLTGILFLVLEPYNKNKLIRFHAFQSIFLHISVFVVYFVLGILLTTIFRIVPVIGLLGTIVYPIFGLGCLVLFVFLMYKAYNNQKIVLPIIGPLAEKQAGV
jgi:uncharacterized membrane protein